MFVGRKETSFLLIELETGKIKATMNTECPWDPFDDEDVDLDELEGSKPSPSEVFIGRTGGLLYFQGQKNVRMTIAG